MHLGYAGCAGLSRCHGRTFCHSPGQLTQLVPEDNELPNAHKVFQHKDASNSAFKWMQQ